MKRKEAGPGRLTANQPLLAVPGDPGRLVGRAAGLAHRRDHLVSLIVLAVMAAGLTLASCSAPTGPPGPTGTLSGTLQAVGGPTGAGPRGLAGQVTLNESNGTRFSVAAGANGRFSVPVTVGTYTITGRSPQYEGDTADCQASRPVTVTKGVTSSVEVDCQER